MKRLFSPVLAPAFLALLALPPTVAAECSLEAKEGETCRVKVTELRPTQFAVGMVAVDCARSKIEAKTRKELKNWLEDPDRQAPAVIGPDGKFYITDHHHLATALYRAKPDKDKGWGEKDKRLHVKIVKNFYTAGDMTQDRFWNAMLENHWAWMYDNKGLAPMNPLLLPANMGGMLNDPYRTLSRWVRESCGYLKKGKDECDKFGSGGSKWFMEFYWANFLRGAAPVPAGQEPVCAVLPYGKECLPEEVGALKNVYRDAMQAALSDRAKDYFQSRGLDPAEYGFNAGGQHLDLEISPQGCERIEPVED